MVDYSVIIPVYNEEGSLKPLLSELLSAMAQLGGKYEIIFVDDGSSDKSTGILSEFNKEFPEVIKVITLPDRSGQTFALRKVWASQQEKLLLL